MVNFLFVLMMIIQIPGTVRCLTFTPIGTTEDKNSFECNTNVSLVCQTQNGQDIIILEINNTQLVNCVTRCYVNTPLLGKYIVTHNFDEGTIRLDIPTITNADASNEFICRGDSTSISIKPIIKVKSLTELIINEMNGTNVVEIKALTSCVLLQYNLTFVWNKTRYFNGKIIEPLSTEGFVIKTTDLTDDSNCIPSDHCGGEARSSTLTFTEETSGGVDYYITCTIVINENVSDNKLRNYTVISERAFAFKGTTPIDPPKNSGLTKTVIIIMSVVVPVGIIVVLLGGLGFRFFLHRRNKAMEAPETPTGFELVRDSLVENSATFRCKPRPYTPGKQEIVLLCHQQGTENTTETALTVRNTAPLTVYLRIDNLKMGCVYACNVFSRSNKGRSEDSNQIMIKTLGLPDIPTDLKVVKVKTNSIHLSWIPGHYRMNEQRFILTLQNVESGDETVEIIKTTKDIPFSHTVELLPAGTKFLISLRAENSVGASGSVGPIEVTTSGNPDPPSELTETAVTPSSITICWKPGCYRRQTQSFVIEYSRAKKQLNNIKWKQKTKDDDLQPLMTCKLDNLRPGTKYAIVLFARNDIGMSYRTQPLFVKTKENINHESN